MHDPKVVYWLCKVVVARGVVSMRICQKFPPVSTEPVPPGSKTKPISNSGSASGTAYWRRRPSCTDVSVHSLCIQGREEWEYLRGTALEASGWLKKEGQEVLQVPEKRIPLQPVARPWWDSCAHTAHGGPQNPPAAPEESHTRAGKCLKEGCDPMGSPCWSRLPAGPVAPRKEELTLEQFCWQDLWLRRESTLEQEEGRVGVKCM